MALADFARRLESGPAPIGIPRFSRQAPPARPAAASFDLKVEDGMWAALKREATRQGATVGELAVHSVFIYLAELDRLTPEGATEPLL
jgi:hypothetical protein